VERTLVGVVVLELLQITLNWRFNEEILEALEELMEYCFGTLVGVK